QSCINSRYPLDAFALTKFPERGPIGAHDLLCHLLKGGIPGNSRLELGPCTGLLHGNLAQRQTDSRGKVLLEFGLECNCTLKEPVSLLVICAVGGGLCQLHQDFMIVWEFDRPAM